MGLVDQLGPGLMASFWQSQPCPNPIFYCKPSKAGSKWVSDVPSLTDHMVDFLSMNLSSFNLLLLIVRILKTRLTHLHLIRLPKFPSRLEVFDIY